MTLNDIVKKLRTKNKEGLTAKEIGEKLKYDINKTRQFIRKAIDAGFISKVTKKDAEAIDGTIRHIPSYIFK